MVLLPPGEGPDGPSLRGLTLVSLIYGATTFLGAENSEVSDVEFLVAVAVMFRPTATLAGSKVKERLPLPSVVMFFSAMSFLPSFVPGGLEKSWIA